MLSPTKLMCCKRHLQSLIIYELNLLILYILSSCYLVCLRVKKNEDTERSTQKEKLWKRGFTRGVEPKIIILGKQYQASTSAIPQQDDFIHKTGKNSNGTNTELHSRSISTKLMNAN